ncbi:MAG: hypothetical protein ABL970_18585 [Nitrospira sp.]
MGWTHWWGVVVILVGWGSGMAMAYNEGGHHYTVSAIFAEGRPATAIADPYKVVEAFCAQLPDLAMELDAITQRQHVLWTKNEWRWGVFGDCQTNRCRHMVATHLFLHALTGTEVVPVRQAAGALIQAIDQEVQAVQKASPQDIQHLVNLACERGFADHLLGDTFAHAELHGDESKPIRLYPTGLGHWRDMHTPDFMLSRQVKKISQNTWQQWVEHASVIIEGRVGGAAVTALAIDLSPEDRSDMKDAFAEQALDMKLLKFLPDLSWKPYTPTLLEWRTDTFLNTLCEEQLQYGPSKRTGGTGVPSIQSIRPQCRTVWEGYLTRALRIFPPAVLPYASYKSEVLDRSGRLTIKLEDGQ